MYRCVLQPNYYYSHRQDQQQSRLWRGFTTTRWKEWAQNKRIITKVYLFWIKSGWHEQPETIDSIGAEHADKSGKEHKEHSVGKQQCMQQKVMRWMRWKQSIPTRTDCSYSQEPLNCSNGVICHDRKTNSCDELHHDANRRTEQMHVIYTIQVRPNCHRMSQIQKKVGQKNRKGLSFTLFKQSVFVKKITRGQN